MHKSGKLILLAGFSGAGKTTMAGVAIERIANLEYLKTYITRPPRNKWEEQNSVEYIFVSHKKYDELRAKSSQWNHGVYDNQFYGADVESINKKLEAGTNIICCIVPDIPTIKRHTETYKTKPIVIWLDTPLEIANKRIKGSRDTSRSKRTSDPLQTSKSANDIKTHADYIMRPTGTLKENQEAFVAMVKNIIEQ